MTLRHRLAIGFLLASLAVIGMIRHEPKAVAKEKMTARNLLVGFRFVFANQVVLGTITLDLFAVLLGGATALLPVYAKDILRVGPEGLGLLQAALPLGALVLLHTLVSRQSRGRIVTLRDRQPELRVREAIDQALSALEHERGDKP